MWRESRCKPHVHNIKDPNGGSRGLMQINGSWTRWLRSRGILSTAEDLFEPEVNLRASLAIHNYAHGRYQKGWNPWRM
jgi:soluble lytic murein transglycosylase-like protein